MSLYLKIWKPEDEQVRLSKREGSKTPDCSSDPKEKRPFSDAGFASKSSNCDCIDGDYTFIDSLLQGISLPFNKSGSSQASLCKK